MLKHQGYVKVVYLSSVWRAARAPARRHTVSCGAARRAAQRGGGRGGGGGALGPAGLRRRRRHHRQAAMATSAPPAAAHHHSHGAPASASTSPVEPTQEPRRHLFTSVALRSWKWRILALDARGPRVFFRFILERCCDWDCNAYWSRIATKVTKEWVRLD